MATPELSTTTGNRVPRTSRPTLKVQQAPQLPFQVQAVSAFKEQQRKLQALADAKRASDSGSTTPALHQETSATNKRKYIHLAIQTATYHLWHQEIISRFLTSLSIALMTSQRS